MSFVFSCSVLELFAPQLQITRITSNVLRWTLRSSGSRMWFAGGKDEKENIHFWMCTVCEVMLFHDENDNKQCDEIEELIYFI